MTNALHMHHTEIRVLIRKHKCYEVKTIGDAFMIVCESPERMLRLALELQTRFHQMDWKTDAINALYIESELEKAESIQGESQAVWNGLRVRCGLHYGKGDVQYDLVTKGYDYYGTVVNAASRIESVCHGGQVGLSQEFWEAVGCNFAGTTVLDLGQNELRGLNAPIRLYQVLPQELAGRRFPPLRLDHAEELDDDDNAESEQGNKTAFDSRPGSAKSRMSMYPPETQFHRHPLVRSGQVTAQELKHQYDTCTTCINTLLGSMPESFKESMFKGLCKRFNVPYRGATGQQLKQAISSLVLRVLPSTVHVVFQEEKPSRCNSEAQV
uniref:Guanylate cyclase domain-containing protein n=1 Tax=Eutreptiella gymnastica TaxID=73025 RepID=A0A7S4FY50_9EUGL